MNNIMYKRLNNKRLVYKLILFLIIFMSSCIGEHKYLRRFVLERSIYWDGIILPVSIRTKDSATIIVAKTKDSMKRLLEQMNEKESPEEILYNSLKENKAICLSTDDYNSLKEDIIVKDAQMDSIYREQGVKGLLETYFRKIDDTFVLSRTLWLGEDERTGFGEEINTGYMSYLLSQNDIFLIYWLDCEYFIFSIYIANNLT